MRRPRAVIVAHRPGPGGAAGPGNGPALAGVPPDEYDPANTRSNWEDGQWAG